MTHSVGMNTANPINFSLSKHARTTGIVLIVIGLVGILLPNLIALSLNLLISSIFLAAAAVLMLHAWHNKKANLSLWFKPFILAVLAFVILLHPAIVWSVLGLLVALYFIFSGFASIVLSFEFKSTAKWLCLSSGMVSFVLGVLVFASWPFGSSAIIGLLIGINFLSDGIALLSIAKQVDKRQVLE